MVALVAVICCAGEISGRRENLSTCGLTARAACGDTRPGEILAGPLIDRRFLCVLRAGFLARRALDLLGIVYIWIGKMNKHALIIGLLILMGSIFSNRDIVNIICKLTYIKYALELRLLSRQLSQIIPPLEKIVDTVKCQLQGEQPIIRYDENSCIEHGSAPLSSIVAGNPMYVSYRFGKRHGPYIEFDNWHNRSNFSYYNMDDKIMDGRIKDDDQILINYTRSNYIKDILIDYDPDSSSDSSSNDESDESDDSDDLIEYISDDESGIEDIQFLYQ